MPGLSQSPGCTSSRMAGSRDPQENQPTLLLHVSNVYPAVRQGLAKTISTAVGSSLLKPMSTIRLWGRTPLWMSTFKHWGHKSNMYASTKLDRCAVSTERWGSTCVLTVLVMDFAIDYSRLWLNCLHATLCLCIAVWTPLLTPQSRTTFQMGSTVRH